MKKIIKYWKIIIVALVCVITSAFAVKLTMAGTVSIVISGDSIDEDVMWEVGSNSVSWNANAFDAGTELALGTGSEITWSSSDPTVIITRNPSTSGNTSLINLQAVGAGTATITATYTGTDASGNPIKTSTEKTISVKLEVLNAPNTVFEDNSSDYIVNTNSNNPLVWTSSNEGVAKVTQGGTGKGIITFKGAGITTIRCSTGDGLLSEEFEVVVNAKFKEKDTLINVPYRGTYTLSTNSGGNIYYESSNPNIVTVNNNGVVRGESAGYTRVFAYAVNSGNVWYPKITKRDIQVYVDFEIVSDSSSIAVGNNLQLNTNILPDYLTGVNWTSSDTSVAEVTSEGVVRGKKKGTATIRATVSCPEVFGTTELKYAELEISVVDSLALSKSEHSMNVGEKVIINAIVTDDVSDIVWETSNESVASIKVDSEDTFFVEVKAEAKGTAIITATQTVNGVKRQATCEISVKQPVIDVQIFPQDDLNLTIGEKYPLVVTFNPSRPDNMNLVWYSPDESIATVDEFGVVTAVGSGEVYVSVVTEDGIKIASKKIKVSKPVESVTIGNTRPNVSFSVGNYQLTYEVLPDEEGVNKDVVWMSTDESIAKVDQSGFVTFVKPGNVTIYVQTKGHNKDGMNLIASWNVVIEQPVTGINVDAEAIVLKNGESHKLTAEILPEDAYNKKVIWSSTDESVAKVDEKGNVTTAGAGKCTIIAQSEDSGDYDVCSVEVYNAVEEIVINKEVYTLKELERLYLADEIKILPEDASNYTIVWKSSKPAVATIDAQRGILNAIKTGETDITITCTNNITSEKYSTQCLVKVNPRITGFKLSATSRTVVKGKTTVLKPIVSPSGIGGYKIEWKSSDESVATVDSTGVVKGIKGGNALITATIEENGYTASCLVTVKEYVSKITVNGGGQYLNKGKSRVVTATVLESTASNRKIKWTTSNAKKVKINSSGKITGVGYGYAYIYARETDGSGKYGKYRIRVIRPVKTIKITPSRVTLLEGKRKQLKAKVTPSNATIKSLQWESSDTNVATVAYDGEVTAVGEGSCRIYAISKDGNKVKGTCKVTVKKGVAATSVRLSASNLTMLNGQTRKITAKLLPTNSTESYKWYSADTSVATVSKNGTITAKGQGTTEIYAMSTVSGVEKSCTVTVLALNSTRITLEQYDTYDLDVFGSSGTIRWYSSNKRVAIVKPSGLVVAKMAGSTTITAKANGKVLYCRVRVIRMKK